MYYLNDNVINHIFTFVDLNKTLTNYSINKKLYEYLTELKFKQMFNMNMQYLLNRNKCFSCIKIDKEIFYCQNRLSKDKKSAFCNICNFYIGTITSIKE